LANQTFAEGFGKLTEGSEKEMEMEKEKYQLSEGLEKFADRGCSAQTGKGECQITPCQKDWRSLLLDAFQLRLARGDGRSDLVRRIGEVH